jgi:UDP-N-acetylglucosamine acyltransferase
MGVLLSGDVPPFLMVAADSDTQGRPRGINSEGLKRRGFDAGRIATIKRAYRTVYVGGTPLADARLQLAEQAKDSSDVAEMLAFIERAERALAR